MKSTRPSITRLVWHRKGDLRLHDNELYPVMKDENTNTIVTRTVSLYVINPADYKARPLAGNNDFRTVTEGPHVSRALIDALEDLRRNLRDLGGDLLIRRGNPLQVVPEISRQIQAQEVIWSQVPGSYERVQSETMKNSLIQQLQVVHTVASYTLHHPDDLPYGEQAWTRLARPNEKRSKKKKKQEEPAAARPEHAIGVDCSPSRFVGIPRIMGDFRRAARTAAPIRPCFPPPTMNRIQPFPVTSSAPGYEDTAIDPGNLPTMQELTQGFQGTSLFGLSASTIDSIIHSASTGPQPNMGETAARKHWQYFLNNHAATADRSLADTSNHQSAHMSIALALGVVSPRHIVESVRQLSELSSCQWLISHMEMRDYFMYSALAADTKLFALHGQQQPVYGSKQRSRQKLKHKEPPEIVWKPLSGCRDLFQKWATGCTGLPLVDAGMTELLATGYCSNRVRQNMASVFTKDLHIDWRVGAEWFQFCLEDHCVAANWGNWQYFGGVGGDPKNRHFRTVSQALKYDQTGSYVAKWLPVKLPLVGENQSEDVEALFRPWDFQEGWTTIVDPVSQYTWQDRQTLEETGRLVEG